MARTKILATVLSGLLALSGCGSSSNQSDAGGDAVDAQDGRDGGPDGAFGDDGGQDAGPDADAGTDAGPDADAGTDAGGDSGIGWPFAEMLLRTENGRLERTDGTAVDFRGAISCCMGGYGWPLFDEDWMAYLAPRGVNFLHARLGPFLTGPGGESDWAAIGGGYLETGGKADLTRFNPAFWSRVRSLIEAAGQRGMWVEIDLADGWAMKHCRWGDVPGYSPWDRAWNIQGEDWCAQAGSVEIIGGNVWERWIRQAVRETGRYGNVLYQDGNEIGIVGGYHPAWSLSIRNIVRDEEARSRYLRHPFGTNSGDPTVMQAPGVDYLEFHQDTALHPAECFGRPCLVNEYNPDPPMTPAEFQTEFCAARAAGTYFWYWRHGQDAGAMEASLDLAARPCP